MGKRPPEKYNPGDLDRTRSNLGNLSREEAKRMASLLGGDIGTEKSDEQLTSKYKELKSSSYSPHPRTTGGKKTGSTVYSGHYKQKKAYNPKIRYIDRIKIDLLASKPEHKIKTKSAVLSSYLSFIVKPKDRINPEFIALGDNYYYSHIEALVSSLKQLLKQLDPLVFRQYVNPFYRDIIRQLISWDLKEMNQNLVLLQKSPRNIEVQKCENLCRYIYRPIMTLNGVELNHIFGALDRLYKILILLHAEEADKLTLIEEGYTTAREKIRIVFKDVAYTCYPLLLKLSGSRFYYYNDFIKYRWNTILSLLQIKKEDSLITPDPIEAALKNQYSLSHLKKALDDEKKKIEDSLRKPYKQRDESEISGAPAFLEQLFPESGWKNYQNLPDLYPYFHPVFNFPKGTELIAAEDPLQQVVILAAVIQELLYGFRNLSIGSAQNEEIEEETGKWHLFIDEMIQNNYNKMLIEYCRNVDKGVEFSAGRFGQKLLVDTYWYKRRFILPYLKFKTLYRSQSIPPTARKFHHSVRNLFRLLQNLLVDFDASEDRKSIIGNYSEPFSFEIENTTSRRLRKVLLAEHIATTNENLVRHTFMIISLLDFLLNSPDSFYYKIEAEDIPIYRSDPVYQGKPLYSVRLIDTEKILNR
ncbi:MAG: hypothetical protein JEZ04_11195 [Spirochaetales bacterium]|nr:hypothetical protein [Spirochaetales bacterium]